MFAAHPFTSFAVDAAEISYITPAIRFAIGVDNLAVQASLGNAEPIVVPYNRRRIHHKGDGAAIARFSQERDDAIISVVKIDPIKSLIRIVELP